MRVLVLSYYFPPYNASGAIRVGKMVKYLLEFGHDVRVITAKNPPLQPTLQLEIPADRVTYTRWINLNAPAGILIGGRGKVASQGFVRHAASKSILTTIGLMYKSLLNFPDGKIGWIPFCLASSKRVLSTWKPDIIYASGMPFSGFLASSILSARHQIPWFAEFRDLFVDDHYYPYPQWRRGADSWLEKRIVPTAAGLVTVSEPLAEVLRTKYDKPTAVILNGFAPEDSPLPSAVPAGTQNKVLRIVHTGTLTGLMYEMRRDPTPLFQALRLLGEVARNVRVAFYGRDHAAVCELAKREGVEACVESFGPVSHKSALEAQAEADVLLLLLWNAPEEKGVYTGKLFEYLGARRPILAIGSMDNVAISLIQERKAGVALTDPGRIADQLRVWMQQKDDHGDIPQLAETVAEGLTRREQTKKLEKFIVDVLART